MSSSEASVPPAPDPRQMERLRSVLAPLARVAQPKVIGIDRIPDRPVLYVGNHTRWAFLDLPFMMSELWERRRIVVRALGDHGHYSIPVWRDLLTLCGMVRGTRANVRELMATGENVLVFPGGGLEVFKGRGKDYQLLWKERVGFARLAIEAGYPIVPFAAVGAEEMLDVVVDEEMPVAAQISGLMRRLVGVPLPPLPRGIGPTLLPRPERLYFWFGEPIETAAYAEAGRSEEDAARDLRDVVKAAVEDGLQTLFAERDADPRRGLLPRLREDADPPALDIPDPGARLVTRAFDAWNELGPAGAAAWLAADVALTDPPELPGGTTWHGRDRAIARLEEVAAALDAERVEPTDARTDGDEVAVEFTVRDGEGVPIARFRARVLIEEEQIARIRVSVDGDQPSGLPLS